MGRAEADVRQAKASDLGNGGQTRTLAHIAFAVGWVDQTKMGPRGEIATNLRNLAILGLP
jgi:hypothetical protein